MEYPASVDILNEYEFVITMPSEMIASVVAKDLESMEQWGGMHSNISCTIVSRSKFRSMTGKTDETSPEVSSSVPVEMLVET